MNDFKTQEVAEMSKIFHLKAKRAQTDEIQAIGAKVSSLSISYSCIKPFAIKRAL